MVRRTLTTLCLALILGVQLPASAFSTRTTAALAHRHQHGKSVQKAPAVTLTAIARSPALEARRYCQQGISHLHRGLHAQATAEFNAALSLRANYAEAYFGRALAYFLARDYERAIEDYTKAQSLYLADRDLANCYFNRAIAYASIGDYDLSIKDYTRTIRLSENFADAYFGRALAYEGKGASEEAISDFAQAIALSPRNTTWHYYKAIALEKLHHDQEALEEYRQFIRLTSAATSLPDREQLKLAQSKIQDLESALE